MKRLIPILIMVLGFAKIATAQSDEAVIKTLSTNDTARTPLYMLKLSNGKELFARDIVILEKEIDYINSLSVVERNAFFKSHPNQKGAVIIEIRPKPNVHILNYKEILDKYAIDTKFRTYKIRVGNILSYGRYIYASADAIASVNVDTEKHEIIIKSKPDLPEKQ